MHFQLCFENWIW